MRIGRPNAITRRVARRWVSGLTTIRSASAATPKGRAAERLPPKNSRSPPPDPLLRSSWPVREWHISNPKRRPQQQHPPHPLRGRAPRPHAAAEAVAVAVVVVAAEVLAPQRLQRSSH